MFRLHLGQARPSRYNPGNLSLPSDRSARLAENRGCEGPSPPDRATLRAESSVQLLARVRAGDRLALETVFERYLPWLLPHARHLLRHARGVVDAEDVVQDTLLQLLKRVTAFEPRHDGALRVYAYRSLQNRIRGELRRFGRKPRPVALDSREVDRSPSPLECAIGAQDLRRYERALGRLRPAERQAVLARLMVDCSYEEAA